MNLPPSSSPLSSLAASSATSSPLSDLSKTPSLPGSPTLARDAAAKRYPSPMSTTASGAQSPSRSDAAALPDSDDVVMDGIVVSGDSARPAKKRRIAATPKERTTDYLDLTKSEMELSREDRCNLDRLVAALRKKKKIVVIAGAGISVSAGIPDFRSSTGMFATAKNQHKLKASGKHLFDASVYKHDDTTQSFHTMVREMAALTQNARPTPFHHLLASLAQEGRLMRLYSQNIDCIDTSMKPLATNVPLNPKGPWPATIQLHGGLEKMVCTKCAKLQTFDGDLFDGPEAPLCDSCIVDDEVRTTHAGKRSHGIGRLRPRFVLYNEYNPDEEAIGNVSSADLKARPDAVIVVGTTLKVPGTRRLVKELCQVTRSRKNGLTIWINTEAEPKGVDFKDCWDLVVRSKCDAVARLAALPPWDCSIGDDYLVSQEEDRENQQRRSKTTFTVSIPASPTEMEHQLDDVKSKQIGDDDDGQGILTPQASPKLSALKKASKKQSKISFTGSTQPDLSKPAKATQSRVRKIRQPAKKNAPKNTLKETFKTVKNASNRASGKKLNIIKDEAVSPSSLPPLRPARRASQENFVYKCDEDTISPPSKPNNMHGLIH